MELGQAWIQAAVLGRIHGVQALGELIRAVLGHVLCKGAGIELAAGNPHPLARASPARNPPMARAKEA